MGTKPAKVCHSGLGPWRHLISNVLKCAQEGGDSQQGLHFTKRCNGESLVCGVPFGFTCVLRSSVGAGLLVLQKFTPPSTYWGPTLYRAYCCPWLLEQKIGRRLVATTSRRAGRRDRPGTIRALQHRVTRRRSLPSRPNAASRGAAALAAHRHPAPPHSCRRPAASAAAALLTRHGRVLVGPCHCCPRRQSTVRFESSESSRTLCAAARRHARRRRHWRRVHTR